MGREVNHDVEAIELPLYGRIAAGTPIEALRDNSAMINVPSTMLPPGDHYALEVAGDSMVEAGILDGDTVIINRCEMADSGSIVVALIDEHEVTLKRLRRKGQTVALEPANPAFETRIFGADRVRVQGPSGRSAAALLTGAFTCLISFTNGPYSPCQRHISD